MARCPDAFACEAIFDRVFARVGNITNVRLTYIAQLTSLASSASSSAAISPSVVSTSSLNELDEQPVCMHGPLECAAARQQLCVARYSADGVGLARLATWYGFVRCQNQHRSDIGTSSLAEYCADQVGLRYAGELQTCAEGPQGLALLVASARRAIAKNVHTSCTVELNDQPRCVHDSGSWRDCPGGHTIAEFTRDICQAYHGADRPVACVDKAY
ncbi:hypothetical protein BDF19DRAFT_424061 [Syncephalis fuscata]|nr:hypothetical protein BDF19DRAFT_424061 [Syncephalis fuscata]